MSTEDFAPPDGFVELGSDDKRRSKRRRHPTPVAFDDLPLSIRRNKAVSLGWRIRCSPDGAGVFSSHDYLPGSRDWPLEKGGQVQWADILFLSQKGPRSGIIFNATLYTVAMRVAEDICDQAEEAVEALMSNEDQEVARLRMFTRPVSNSKFKGSEVIFSPHRMLPSLGGVTREAAQAAWVRDRWDALGSLVSMGENAKILPDYEYGTGLELVTAHTNLTVEAVASAIENFRARGEIEYALPLDFKSQQETIEAILLGKLWSWDATQARAEGKQPPSRPEDKAGALLGYESNAIKL